MKTSKQMIPVISILALVIVLATLGLTAVARTGRTFQVAAVDTGSPSPTARPLIEPKQSQQLDPLAQTASAIAEQIPATPSLGVTRFFPPTANTATQTAY